MKAVLLLALAALLSGPAEAVLGRQPKRHRPSVITSAVELLAKAAELLHITTPQFVYHSDCDDSKIKLIDARWAGRDSRESLF